MKQKSIVNRKNHDIDKEKMLLAGDSAEKIWLHRFPKFQRHITFSKPAIY